MREIKFRAWDGNKIWTNLTELQFGINGYSGNRAISFHLPSGGFCTTEHLMQFTGLKDKNGKEIYEGDILSSWDTNFEVTFNNSVYWVKGISKLKAFMLYDFMKQEGHEIIGNIYENPELLTPPTQ